MEWLRSVAQIIMDVLWEWLRSVAKVQAASETEFSNGFLFGELLNNYNQQLGFPDE